MHKRKNWVIIIAVTFFVVMLALTFFAEDSSASGEREAAEIVKEEKTYNSFITLYEEHIGCGIWQTIMYDPQTKIIWTYVEGGDGGGLSIIYNVDGSPMLYEP